ncbi:MAG: serine/threonine-protein kinase [Muribaculaceae bacterium]|nr:serine/threonine-protein kinase [Muribaculaceae bacterium]
MSQLKAGATLRGGAYVIKKVLGQGSFGITYLAEHTALGKKVAIKEFFMKDLNSRAEDGSITGMTRGSLSHMYAEKFRKEAANLARMKHLNIVEVTDAFDENGTYYYVMEHIEGENLNDYIKHHRLSEDEAVGIARDIATALQYMHEQHRMLHLDLKPGNVMRRSSDGHIFLIDFGLSKHYSEGGQPETSTTIGLGTAGYAPIEQGNQAKDGDFRPTIDIYALGATLFKLLTGNTPPASSEIAYDMNFVPNALSSAGVSPGVVQIVSNAMAGNPAMRTATAHNFISQLSGNALTIDQTRSDVTITESKSKPKSKSKKGMVLGAIFVIMAVIGAACFYFLQDSTAKYVYDENATIEQVKADAEKGDAAAQALLSEYYVSGMNKVKINEQEAYEWARKSADQGNPFGQCRLAWFYNNGEIVEKDSVKAEELYKAVLPLLRELAEKGNARAQCNLGYCFYYGNGVAKDYNEAVKWLRKAAEQGDATAQNNLGVFYHEGEGMAKDYNEAVKWLRLAAEQGNARAQSSLGYCYENGQGVAKDINEAVKWYRLAAEQGNAIGQRVLGLCYYNGNGVAKDYSEAVKWFRLAAEQGDDWGQNNLGACYGNGYGVTKSEEEAIKWYKMAARRGNETAQQNLRNLGITEWNVVFVGEKR